MKKLIALLLALVMVLGLAACGGGEPKQDNNEKDGIIQNTDESKHDSEDENAQQSEVSTTAPHEITVEYLMSCPESPEEIFSVTDNGDGTGTINGFAPDCQETPEILVIPDTVNGLTITAIGNNAFAETLDNKLKAVYTGDKVQTISEMAFFWCQELRVVVLGSDVRDLGQNVFLSCTSLTEIVLNAGLETIYEGCFSECFMLKQIEIPDSVTYIQDFTFLSCTSLEEVRLSASIPVITEGLFHGCTSLKTIQIPDGVTGIQNGAFKNCTALESVYIPDTVTEFGTDIFSECHEDVTIIATKGSAAEQYANEKGIHFQAK